MTRMKMIGYILSLAAVFGLGMLMGRLPQASGAAKSTGQIRRVGMVIGLKPEMIQKYKEVHDDSNPGVRDLLNKYHKHNFSIFIQQIEGKWYEFGYYEYTGDDLEGDRAKQSKEERNIEWMKMCDPMQIPLEGARGWTRMEMVFHND